MEFCVNWQNSAYMVILHASVSFFENTPLLKILSEIPTECQTVWIQIRPDIL